jgi:asparagine synthase (glutamine-hydrolysing)
MCGILGQMNFGNAPMPRLNLYLLHHRGPDGNGEWLSQNGKVYLGHTRLAILEPTPAGRQPMSDASGRFVLTFNGEVYNHMKLRTLLPTVQWQGTSDTETLVELLAHKGVQAICLLKGMFAFALYDNLDGSVLLVRDRLGIKPLWFRRGDNLFRFSSEVRVLLGPGEAVFTRSALSEYLAFGRMPGSGEVFKDISSVQAGTWIKLHPDGTVAQVQWWPKDSFHAFKPQSLKESNKRVNQLVTTAIEEHLISDVGVGAFLSGGIDSSIVTLVAGKVLGKSLRTFTVGFPQDDFDERFIARKVAKKAGTEHHELEVSKDVCLAAVKEAVYNLDLPSVDAINTFIVSKAVRETGLKVVLSGLGGDELFGGYPSFRSTPLLSWLGRFPNSVNKQLVNLLPKSLKEKLNGLNNYSVDNLTIARRRFISISKLKSLGFGPGIPFVPPAPQGLDKMSQISWAELHGYTIPMLLRDSDQMSMALGLEIRVPFLDHHLVEEILQLSQQYKKGSGIKSLLVDAFRSVLPLEVYNRPKQGFALPMNNWIKGPLSEFVREGVDAAADRLQLQEPLLLMKRFNQQKLHWTRIWSWNVLGHWLLKHKVSATSLSEDTNTRNFSASLLP